MLRRGGIQILTTCHGSRVMGHGNTKHDNNDAAELHFGSEKLAFSVVCCSRCFFGKWRNDYHGDEIYKSCTFFLSFFLSFYLSSVFITSSLGEGRSEYIRWFEQGPSFLFCFILLLFGVLIRKNV